MSTRGRDTSCRDDGAAVLANTRLYRGPDHRGFRHGQGDPEVENPLLVIGQQPVRSLEE